MNPSNMLVANNQHDQIADWVNAWEEPDALSDVAVAAGLLGLMAGLLAVIRLSGTHFPDALFWRALPLLLVVPPGLFMGALLAPGGLLDSGSSGSRAMQLGLGGLASYVAPLLLLSLAGGLACLR